jgi:hypothetical protein
MEGYCKAAGWPSCILCMQEHLSRRCELGSKRHFEAYHIACMGNQSIVLTSGAYAFDAELRVAGSRVSVACSLSGLIGVIAASLRRYQWYALAISDSTPYA